MTFFKNNSLIKNLIDRSFHLDIFFSHPKNAQDPIQRRPSEREIYLVLCKKVFDFPRIRLKCFQCHIIQKNWTKGWQLVSIMDKLFSSIESQINWFFLWLWGVQTTSVMYWRRYPSAKSASDGRKDGTDCHGVHRRTNIKRLHRSSIHQRIQNVYAFSSISLSFSYKGWSL